MYLLQLSHHHYVKIPIDDWSTEPVLWRGCEYTQAGLTELCLCQIIVTFFCGLVYKVTFSNFYILCVSYYYAEDTSILGFSFHAIFEINWGGRWLPSTLAWDLYSHDVQTHIGMHMCSSVSWVYFPASPLNFGHEDSTALNVHYM